MAAWRQGAWRTGAWRSGAWRGMSEAVEAVSDWLIRAVTAASWTRR